MTKDSLKDALHELSWSQKHFAQRLRVDQDTVSRWCTGKSAVPGYAVAYIELALGISRIAAGLQA